MPWHDSPHWTSPHREAAHWLHLPTAGASVVWMPHHGELHIEQECPTILGSRDAVLEQACHVKHCPNDMSQTAALLNRAERTQVQNSLQSAADRPLSLSVYAPPDQSFKTLCGARYMLKAWCKPDKPGTPVTLRALCSHPAGTVVQC